MLYTIVTNDLERRTAEHKEGSSGSLTAWGQKSAGILGEARGE